MYAGPAAQWVSSKAVSNNCRQTRGGTESVLKLGHVVACDGLCPIELLIGQKRLRKLELNPDDGGRLV